MSWLRRHGGALDEQDGAAIAALREQGTDLTVPLRVDHFIVDLDSDSARAATRRLADGFEVVVFAPAGSSAPWAEQAGAQEIDAVEPVGWTVQATRAMVVDEETIAAARSELTVLAHELGGAYDGWGIDLV